MKQPIDPSKYGSLSTSRLVALLDSKERDLKHTWTNRALEFLLELSGLKMSPTLSLSSLSTIISTTATLRQRASNSSPQVLPVVAAHHLSNLRKLKRPVLGSKTPESDTIVKTTTLAPHVSASLTDHHDAEVRMHQNLDSALTTINRGHDRFDSQLRKPRDQGTSLNLRRPPDWKLHVEFEARDPFPPSALFYTNPKNPETARSVFVLALYTR